MSAPALFDPSYRPGCAVFSDCGRYRYRLTRRWTGARGPVCTIVGCNPSTADETDNDPTVRRCIDFAIRFGAVELQLVNVYAARATDPKRLWDFTDPVGPDNHRYLTEAAEAAHASGGVVVAAWGTNPRPEHTAELTALLTMAGPVMSLGVTQAGHPRHPLYLRRDTPLMRWPATAFIRKES